MKEMWRSAAALGMRPERLELLDRTIGGWIGGGEFPAALVRVMRHGEVVFNEKYGVSFTEPEPTPISWEAIFPLSSISKAVTATAALALQEDGGIDLCRPIQELIPEFEGEDKEGACLWHCLTHTTGIDEEKSGAFFWEYCEKEFSLARPREFATKEEYEEFDKRLNEKLGITEDSDLNARMTIALKAPLTYKPHTQMSYCGTGFELISLAIKRTTGLTLDEYARKRLFEPLGMADTHWVLPRDKWGRVVRRNETCRYGEWLHSDHCMTNTSAAGGLKSTIGDMARYAQMILNGGKLDGVRVLSSATVREFATDHNQGLMSIYGKEVFKNSFWGLGICLRGDKMESSMLRSKSSMDHGGAGGAYILIDPEYDMCYCWFAVDPARADYPFVGRFTNMVMSAIE